LTDAVSAALLKSMHAEFHRRRKKLLCPDLEVFWIGPHLAELETRETIRQCFQEAVGKRFTFNITHAATVVEAEKLVAVGSRLIGQIVSGRVLVITTVGMERRVREMLNKSRVKDAKAIKEPSTDATTITHADTKAPEEEQNKLKIIVYHNNYRSYQKHLTMLMYQPEFIAVGSPALKDIIMTSGANLTSVTEADLTRIETELENLTTSS